MSQIEKLINKLNSKPVPNDISFNEIKKLAEYFGCKVLTGGNHQIRIADKESGTVIPIPRHGKHVPEAYIIELKNLFNEINNRKNESKGEKK